MDLLDDFLEILGELIRDASGDGDPTESKKRGVEIVVDAISKSGSFVRDTRDIVDVLKRNRRVVMASSAKFKYLRPTRANIVPLLSVDAEFQDDGTAKVTLTVVLMMVHDDILNGIGLRFETPEGPGVHNFHHAQLVSRVGREIEIPNCPPWLPVKQPSFALDAVCAPELLLCLVMSLYGAEKISSWLGSSTISRYARTMRGLPTLP